MFTLLLAFITLVVPTVVLGAESTPSLYTLLHTIGHEEFSQRAKARLVQNEAGSWEFRVERAMLDDVEGLVEAAVAGSSYRVQLKSDNGVFFASMDACALAASSMQHIFRVHVASHTDPPSASISSFSIHPPSTFSSCPDDPEKRRELARAGINAAKDAKTGQVRFLVKTEVLNAETNEMLPVALTGLASPYPGQDLSKHGGKGGAEGEEGEKKEQGWMSKLSGWMWPALLAYAALSFFGGGDEPAQGRRKRRAEGGSG